MFKQSEYYLLLNRAYDNGSDTQGQLYYIDINRSMRYVFTQEPPAGKRLLPGEYELRLCRVGKTYQAYCKSSDGFIKKSTLMWGIITLPNSEDPIFYIKSDKPEKYITVGDILENNSKGPGVINEGVRPYAFLLSAIYAAFEKSERVYLHILDTDKKIVEQFK